MATPTITPIHDWYCPNCGATDQTQEVRPHTRMHTCPRLYMMSAPMVLRGTKAKIEVREREDYIGQEDVQMFQGRPIMSIVTQRADGSNDAMVFAPTAHLRVKEA